MGNKTLILASVLLLVGCGAPARADAPLAAGAAVRQVMESLRTNDRATFLATLADDYDYAGLKKAGLNPFGTFGILYDQLIYRVLEVLPSGAGVATALVDTDFTGRVNLDAVGNGKPTVFGSARFWIEVRRQENGTWLGSALRLVRLSYTHADTPFTTVQGVSVNGRSSLIVPPGAALDVEGLTEFGGVQTFAIGPTFTSINLDLGQNLMAFQPWSAAVTAPSQPGRYYLDTVAFVSAHLQDGRYFLSWDEVTIPVVVK